MSWQQPSSTCRGIGRFGSKRGCSLNHAWVASCANIEAAKSRGRPRRQRMAVTLPRLRVSAAKSRTEETAALAKDLTPGATG
eukprot:CAMPEP_0194284054 /NCGR_PEP_ID=MMETSP0169-20130528/26623_1 /TAXON_ID=218684 /ORGANISM="Corethron pennatum, Strain L29A3" /LENGTH=81 /DNA_ID=CAMNT_0039029777 /DNA_START=236 /DNA_END=482 /DNA_ORIENTATION=+